MQHGIRKRRSMSLWTAIVMVVAVAGVTQAANYRWTGGGTTNLWSTPANWDVDDGGWQTATTPPGADDVVYLGDAAPDAPQEIVLDGDVTIYRLFMEATGDRDYVISSLLDGEGDAYTLALTAAIASGSWVSGFVQSLVATSELTLRVPIDFPEMPNTLGSMFQLLSSEGARVIVERPIFSKTEFSGTRTFYVTGATSTPTQTETGGILELRAPILQVQRFNVRFGAVVVLNYAGPEHVIAQYIELQTYGSIWVQQNATTGNGMFFSSTGFFRAYEAGDEERTLSINGSVTRGGTYHVGPSKPESPGRFVMTISSLEVDGGMALMPRFNLATNSVLHIRRRQTVPLNRDNQNIIYGPGALAKLNTDWAVTTIGATNTYTGGTFVEAGTIQLVGDNLFGEPEFYVEGQIGPGPLWIATEAAFDLNGIDQTISALHGAGTVQLGGATLTATNGVSPGTNSVGTLTVAGAGSLALGGQASLFEFADTDTHDRVVFTGSADLSLSGTLQLTGPEGFAEYGAGRYTLIEMNGGTIAGAFDTLIPPEGMDAEVDTLSGDVEVILTKRPTGTILLVR